MKPKITVLIPTLNEETAIGDVIEGFKKEGFTDIVVIDGHSTDRTRDIALEKGAEVIVQRGRGKGNAIKQAFSSIECDVLVLIDGDGTYIPSESKDLIKPILNDEADHVIGNRFARYEKGAFTRLNLIGNKLLNLAFRLTFGEKLHDILSGYRALKGELIRDLSLYSSGFEIEAELTAETLRRGYRIKEVPITYRARRGETKLRPLRDGLRIALTIYDLLKMHKPMRYFGFIGAVMIFLGFISGVYVVMEWMKGITHYLLAILTALFIISGLQFVMFGVLGDLIVSLHRELLRRK